MHYQELKQYLEKFEENGRTLHRCTICGKSSNDRSNMRKHVENIHFPGSYLYSCDLCAETFSTKNKLNHHKYKHHNTQFSTFFNVNQ